MISDTEIVEGIGIYIYDQPIKRMDHIDGRGRAQNVEETVHNYLDGVAVGSQMSLSWSNL